MACLFRVGFARVVNVTGIKCLGSVQSTRCISGKTRRVPEPGKGKPAPWNYKRNRYTLLNYFFDKTTARFDENTKLIVVEGSVASGKSKFAKELAEELEMQYFPEANMDMVYVNDYGFDLRTLDEQVPEDCRTFDVDNFLRNPKHRQSATFQIKQYGIKYSQYIDALAHILSTGQGVVLDRCAYSDFAFIEAMYDQGYVSRGARSVYYEVRKNSISELLRPHLVVYLDVPVPKILENIKKRNISYEVNSQAMNPAYLTKLENIYKHQYLKEISNYSELLVYDWSNGGDTEVVVEDIERIDFDRYDVQDRKMKDWVHHLEEDWAGLRHTYADNKDFLMTYLNVPCFQVPELVVEAEDMHEYRLVLESSPGERYARGYDSSMGDQGILFKTSIDHRQTLPLRERRDAQGNFN